MVPPEGPTRVTPESFGLFVRPTSIEKEDRVVEGVPRPPDPAPLLSTWLTVTDAERPSGHRLRRTAFADGARLIGLDPDEVYARAVSNVLDAGVEFEPHPVVSGAIRARSPFPSGILAVPELFEAKRDEVDGELLIFATTLRDIGLVGSDDPGLEAAFDHAVTEYAAAVAQGISPLLYRIVPDDGPASAKLEPWVPEPASRLHRLYQRARLTQLELIYGPMLQEALDFSYPDGDRFAVNSRPLWAYVEEEDALRSYAVWTIETTVSAVAPADWIAITVARPTSPVRYWIRPEHLATVPGLTMRETREHGPTLWMISFPENFKDAAVKGLLADIKKHGGQTTRKMGGVGESVQVHDWVPSKNGWYGSRVAQGAEFPQVQLSG